MSGFNQLTAGRPDARPLTLVVGVIIVVLFAVVACAICTGTYGIPVGQVPGIIVHAVAPSLDLPVEWAQMAETVVMEVRLPRIAAAILVGVALAVAGTAYQSTFRNPLVSPDLLGVSSGACIGAAGAILLGMGVAGIQLAAFVGGIAAVALTVTIPRLLRRSSTMTLVLSGIIVGGFCGSILGLIKYLADPETELPEITYWQMGSLANIDIDTLVFVAPVIIASVAVIVCMRWRINVISLGDREAQTLGVNLRLERGIIILFATLLTASATCIAGTVGWVGLVLPHLSRFLVGPNACRTLPVVIALSAAFMLVIDTLARCSGIEIPLGILTGFIGTPFFIVLLAQQRNELL